MRVLAVGNSALCILIAFFAGTSYGANQAKSKVTSLLQDSLIERFTPGLAHLLAALLAFVPGCAHVEPPARAERQMFKGVELYSWRDAGSGDWRFALLAGTNRNKSIEEIRLGPTAGHDLPSLKRTLSALAVGESVIWRSPHPDLSFPPDPVLRELRAFAVEQRLELVIAR